MSGLLVRAGVAPVPPQQVPVSEPRSSATSEMIIVRAPRPVRLPLGVNVQDGPGDLAPVGAVRIGIMHDEMLFVVSRERRIGGCEIGDIGIEGFRLYTSRSRKFDGAPT